MQQPLEIDAGAGSWCQGWPEIYVAKQGMVVALDEKLKHRLSSI